MVAVVLQLAHEVPSLRDEDCKNLYFRHWRKSKIYVTNTNANMNKNKYKCWLNLNVFYKLKGTTNYQAIYYFFPSHFEKKDGDIENLNGHVVQIE